MMSAKRSVVLCAILVGAFGCAPQSPEADPAYVSPTHYSNYNSKQISAEMQRVSAKLEQAEQTNTTGQVLNTALAAFAVSQGYGLTGGDDDVRYKRLVNQYDVLEQTSIQKECRI